MRICWLLIGLTAKLDDGPYGHCGSAVPGRLPDGGTLVDWSRPKVRPMPLTWKKSFGAIVLQQGQVDWYLVPEPVASVATSVPSPVDPVQLILPLFRTFELE